MVGKCGNGIDRAEASVFGPHRTSEDQSQSIDIQNPSSGQFVGSNDPSKQTPSAIEATTQQDNAILPSFTLSNPPRYPIKHRHLAAKVKFSAHTVDLSNLKFYIQFCLHAAYAFHLPCSLPTSLPIQTSLRTVPRSAFVHKPSQENFIKKVHSRYFKIFDSDVETVKEYLEYIASNGLEGVSLKANIFDRKEVGFGQKMVTPKEGREIEEPTQERVKQMADDLIQSGFGSDEPAEVDTSVATAKEPASVVDITNN